MVTELRQILRETVEDPATGGIDHAAVLRAGVDRVRRRRRAGVVGAAAAVAVVTAAVVVPGGRSPGPAEHVLPAAPVRLTLDDAQPVEPQVLVRTRTVQSGGDDIDYDRIDGITEDGLVVRARYTYRGDISEYGLVDPESGRTDWLPRPPWDIGSPQPLELGADRLLFLDNRNAERHHTLVFDRTTRTWTHPELELPDGRDRFFGLYGQLGDDERVYFPDLSEEEQPDPSSIVATREWWSAPVTGGPARHETALDGLAVTWSGTARATADAAGRIRLTEDGVTRTVTEAKPAGCAGLPALTIAGSRLIAGYVCADRSKLVVLDQRGAPELSVEGDWLGVVAADDRYALVSGNSATFVLDLERQELLRLGRSAAMMAMDLLPTPAVSGDLVAWNVWGPADSSKVSDIVYRVGRLP